MNNSILGSRGISLALLTLSLLFVALLFFSPLGERLRQAQQLTEPRLIGVATGAIHPSGPWVEVTKWIFSNKIEIKLVISHFDESQKTEPLIQNFQIPDAFNGHALIRNSLASLAILNTDQDEWAEITVPFFEKNLTPRLYVLKYDPQIRQFIRLNDKD